MVIVVLVGSSCKWVVSGRQVVSFEVEKASFLTKRGSKAEILRGLLCDCDRSR